MKSDISRFWDVPLIVGRAIAVGLKTPELASEHPEQGLGSEISKAMSDPTRDEHNESQTASDNNGLNSLATQGTRALYDSTRDEHTENNDAHFKSLGSIKTGGNSDPTRDEHFDAEPNVEIVRNPLGSIMTLSNKDSTCDEPTWDS